MQDAVIPISNAQALAWRLRHQSLNPTVATSVVEVVSRAVAIRGWPAEGAALAIAVRLAIAKADPFALDRALDAGEIVRSYAFRGGSYLFTPEHASMLLSVRTATRIWEKPRWQRQGDFLLDDWEPFRHAIREVLADGPKTRDEIGAHLTTIPALRHLAVGATGTGSDSLYKPLHWWGDICFGPYRDGHATFRLLAGDPRWPGLPDVDTAGRQAIACYLGAYGPATMENLLYWLTEGLGVPRRRLARWLADLGDEVSIIRTESGESYVLTADLKELATATPSESVHLLPGFDPWVLNPGTADTRIVPSTRRALATRGANLVMRGGEMTGTWRIRGQTLDIAWFSDAGKPPATAIDVAIQRLAAIRALDHDLTPSVTIIP